MKYTIENDLFKVEVNECGAELCSIYSKKKKREYMWQQDPEVWANAAPVLFPFIGSLKGGQYEYEGVSIASYSDRNSDRLPAYHRLDLSVNYKPNKNPNAKLKGEWVLGLYNAYNRKNAASVSFGQNLETGANEATRTAIFGIVPSITYNFKF